MSEKRCTKCDEVKHFIEYSKDKQKSDGMTSNCKSCLYEYRESRRVELADGAKIYRSKNKEKISEAKKTHYRKNRDEILADSKLYQSKNKDKINARIKKKRETNAEFRVSCCLRKRLNRAIKGENKSAATKELLGCTYKYVRQHLENQFTEGMSWDNHGLHGWHIDHIMPCASFDLSDPEQQRECFHYTNLQPLWAEDNLKKSDKILNQ